MSKVKSKLQTYASANLYCKKDIVSLPNFRALLDAVAQNDIRTDDGCGFVRAPFEALMRSGEIEDVIRNELDVLARDPRHCPSGSSGTTQLLADSAMMTLTATILEERHAAPAAVYSPAANALMGNLGPADLAMCVHQRPAGADVKVFDATQKLMLRPPISLTVGETLALSSQRDVVEYRCRGRSLVLKLTSQFSQQLIWVYDKHNGTPAMASAGNLHSSRVQMMMRTLAALESQPGRDVTDPRSVESVADLCSHDLHFIRWGAVQTLCNVDFERGKKALLDAIDDPHPHVATAARSSVAKLRQQGLIT